MVQVFHKRCKSNTINFLYFRSSL